MFTGTTPKEVLYILKDMLRDCRGNIYTGCSDNFTVDRLLASMGLSVFGNDVSLYSRLISDILLNRKTQMTVTDGDLSKAFAGWEETKYKPLVEVMFAVRISQFHKRDNPYRQEYWNTYLNSAHEYYTLTLEKFEKTKPFDFNISDFYFGDFITHLKAKKGKGTGVAFPPTYRGGYEKIFSFVEQSFQYEKPQYTVFNPRQSVGVIGDLLEDGDNIILLDRDTEDLKQYKAARIDIKSKHSLFIYSSLPGRKPSYFFSAKKHLKPSGIHVTPPDFTITDDTAISVSCVELSDVNYFKCFYMSKRVDYSDGGDMGLAFFAGGKAFGFVSFSLYLKTVPEYLVMLSDFVANSDIERLSKLLIMLVRSSDVK
jgi:hypothetical protein